MADSVKFFWFGFGFGVLTGLIVSLLNIDLPRQIAVILGKLKRSSVKREVLIVKSGGIDPNKLPVKSSFLESNSGSRKVGTDYDGSIEVNGFVIEFNKLGSLEDFLTKLSSGVRTR